jgi:hypothetical protein
MQTDGFQRAQILDRNCGVENGKQFQRGLRIHTGEFAFSCFRKSPSGAIAPRFYHPVMVLRMT